MKELEGLIRALEAKSTELQDTIFQNNTDLEAFKMNIQMNMRGVSGLMDRVRELEEHDEDHEKRIAELESGFKDLGNKILMLGGKGGDGIDTDALSQLLDNLKSELDDKYASKDAFEDLVGRVEKLENDYV